MVNQTVGYIKEKIGRSFYKAMVARFIAYKQVPLFEIVETTVTDQKTQKPIKAYEKKPVWTEQTKNLPEKDRVQEIVLKPIYRIVHQEYFSPYQLFIDVPKATSTFIVDLRNEAYQRSEGHIFFWDFDTGKPLDLSGVIIVSDNPHDLHNAVRTSHIDKWAEKGKAEEKWLYFIAGFGIAIAIGLIIGLLISGSFGGGAVYIPQPTPIIPLPGA